MLTIQIDDLRGPEIAALLEEHLEDMRRISPPESVHALDLEKLRRTDITFWTIWDGTDLAGCGALRELSSHHGEIKSMRTARSFRQRGVGKTMLTHILEEARRRDYVRLSLETGSQPEFAPARRLYASAGFTECPPFGDYGADSNSTFMTRELSSRLR
ncbi:MAG: GNAT family N-acetyltransferase [Synoicihabitans sp.]